MNLAQTFQSAYQDATDTLDLADGRQFRKMFTYFDTDKDDFLTGRQAIRLLNIIGHGSNSEDVDESQSYSFLDLSKIAAKVLKEETQTLEGLEVRAWNILDNFHRTEIEAQQLDQFFRSVNINLTPQQLERFMDRFGFEDEVTSEKVFDTDSYVSLMDHFGPGSAEERDDES